MTDARVEKALEKFDRVTRQIDSRDGAAIEAARRERRRLTAGLFSTLKRISLAVLAVAVATTLIGLFIRPIGIFGLIGAIAVGLALVAYFGLRSAAGPVLPKVEPDLANAAMVQRFDSYLFRSRRLLPPDAQGEVDKISERLPALRETLGRIPNGDPAAQDARRLMSTHLPGLIDRYLNVPAAYRGATDGEDKTVGQRLTEGLKAGRDALGDIADRLAQMDIAALETQGRFIQSRYRDEEVEG